MSSSHRFPSFPFKTNGGGENKNTSNGRLNTFQAPNGQNREANWTSTFTRNVQALRSSDPLDAAGQGPGCMEKHRSKLATRLLRGVGFGVEEAT